MANDQPPQEQSPPSKVARLSLDSGAVTMAAAATPLDFGASDKKSFTFMQLQEMEQQALIYKYMAAGVPVPLHLVLPIWKSFATAAARNPHLYPTLMEWGNLCWEYKHSMEAEPGRCRRTDGKKWRCLRNVLPEQKYCKHHLHRGRNRSRKPVETREA